MRELMLYCSGQWADAVADALLQAGALSASVEDADADTPDESALFGEPGSDADERKWSRCRLTALLPAGLDVAALVAQVQSELPIVDFSQWSEQTVAEQDWVRTTQSQFGPIDVSDKLMIVPSWHRNQTPIQGNKIVLELDPGLAFGTGSHPTTHLCLQWLSQKLVPGARVLDYGCGSGILAIAANLLGATEVWAVDIDEQAVRTTQINAQVNGATVQAGLPDAVPDGTFDVVVANILSSPLKVLAPLLAAKVAPGGYLVLSGILVEQAQEVAAFYAPWLVMDLWQTQDGWVCLAGQLQGRAMA